MSKTFFLKNLLLWLIVLCYACKDKDDSLDVDEPDTPNGSTYVHTEVNYVRIVALGTSASGGSWLLNKDNGLLKNYTVDEILDMINDLKPDRLERFISDLPNLEETLPVKAGEPSITVKQFLDAAIKAGSADCRIIPELNLQLIADN